MFPAISDYNKRLILLSVIQLSNGHYEKIQIKVKKAWKIIKYQWEWVFFHMGLSLKPIKADTEKKEC